MRPAVLVTGTIDRPDILEMFREAASEASLTFLEYHYNYGVPIHPEHFAPHGAVRFWHEFKSVHSLLDQLRPARIVFLHITSLNQVALKVAAQQRGIPTLHLEHGFRQRFSASRERFARQRQADKRLTVSKLRRELPSIVGNHGLFARSLPGIRPPARRALLAFALETYRQGATPDVLLKYAHLRQPDRYIAFSPEIFEFHRTQDALTDQDMERVIFIGLPQFDAFCNLPPAPIEASNVILIDHQFHSANIFGWTIEYRKWWARCLYDLLTSLQLRLFVKLHPGDVSAVWEPYLATGNVQIIGQERLRELLPRTTLILGTFSTLQLPLAAAPHTALITLEIHPEKGHLPSRPFVEAGVADAVTSFEELRGLLVDREGVAARQRPRKPAYIRRFLHRMDGKAGARLKQLLVEGEISQPSSP